MQINYKKYLVNLNGEKVDSIYRWADMKELAHKRIIKVNKIENRVYLFTAVGEAYMLYADKATCDDIEFMENCDEYIDESFSDVNYQSPSSHYNESCTELKFGEPDSTNMIVWSSSTDIIPNVDVIKYKFTNDLVSLNMYLNEVKTEIFPEELIGEEIDKVEYDSTHLTLYLKSNRVITVGERDYSSDEFCGSLLSVTGNLNRAVNATITDATKYVVSDTFDSEGELIGESITIVLNFKRGAIVCKYLTSESCGAETDFLLQRTIIK